MVSDICGYGDLSSNNTVHWHVGCALYRYIAENIKVTNCTVLSCYNPTYTSSFLIVCPPLNSLGPTSEDWVVTYLASFELNKV